MIVLLLGVSACAQSNVDPVHRDARPGLTPPSTERDLAGTPLTFIENRGQVDSRIRYYLQGAGAPVSFTSRGLLIGLEDRNGTSQRWNLGLDFLGAEPVRPEGVGKSPTIVSYFTGPSEEWRTGLPTFSGVRYEDLWPGIDLVYSGTGKQLKYSFLVEPGADPSDLRLAYRGATSVTVNARGQLEASTPAGTVVDRAPYSYQQRLGGRTEVESSFAVRGDSVGFRIGAYERTRPLVIDPAVLLYAGFIGGSAHDTGRGVAVDGTGAAYVAGRTASADFPATVGPDTTYNINSDAFVAKVNPAGTGLVYAGFIGGSAGDVANGVAVDGAGAAYVAGVTESADFPAQVGPDTSYNGGANDAFVAKVNPAGTGLVYAGFIGGSDFDSGQGVAVDGAGAAYVAGSTNSADFPAQVGPDTAFDGYDAFAAKVNASGTGLTYAGFIGGTGMENGNSIAVDEAGAAYVTGRTDSGDFPATVGPDVTHNLSDDAFVAKVNPAGTGFLYAGFIGGSGGDGGDGLAVDEEGAAYVTGETGSSTDFPAQVGPDTSYNGGSTDAFVAKVNPAGTGLVYAGFIGGSDLELGGGVALDRTGAAYVGGATRSTDFPAQVGPDTSYNGGVSDIFVAKLNPAGTGFVYAGYIGGAGLECDGCAGVAVDRGGNAYLASDTNSGDTFPSLVGPDTSANGGLDMFIAKVETTELCQGKVVTELGSEAADTIVGTPNPDVILALGGNDKISTRGGKDRVCGGIGNDREKGGGGNDRLLGEQGRDFLNGGGGKRDRCIGGPNKDRGGKGCERGRL